MKDIVIGVIYNYGWNEVKNWALSLTKSGFSGRKVLIAYNTKPGLSEKLNELGIELFQADFHSRGQSISIPPLKVIDIRHFHIWYFLKDLNPVDYRYVLATDVRDVIFQTDPSKRLELYYEYSPAKFLAAAEGIKLKDEPWNAKFMYDGFGPIIYEQFKNEEVLNCGIIAGTFEYFKNFELLLFSLAERNLMLGMDCIDQTSLLMLAHTVAKTEVQIISHAAGWACQCGIMLDPQKIDNFRPHLTSKEPIVKNGLVYTSTNELFCIVHQFDRNPQLLSIINERYSE